MTLCSFILSAFLAAFPGVSNQPVTVASAIEEIGSDSVRLTFNLNIQKGWHVYSTNQKGGPTSAELQLDSVAGLQLDRTLGYEGTLVSHMDQAFGTEVSYFEDHVMFVQKAAVLSPDWYIEGNLTYGACNDVSCLPPTHVDFAYAASSQTVADAPLTGTDLSALPEYNPQTWKPVEYATGTPVKSGHGLLGLFLTSFLGGLLALLTPCVWPVIPMTVSFFLKRTKERGKAISDAFIFGLAIMAVYVSLGLIITLIFGADALNSLATNAVVNILFFLILVAFALSFFGLFELRLPGSWSTGTDRGARKSGLAGIFFMALTLAIVSFSCTGPIIGFLLVDAAQNGSLLAPTVGMTGFSLALAIPFALFAMFPNWMESMPKSGEWMKKVKVTLGFVELAFSLKFLSVADMAYGWGILPRELFVLLWALMALILSLYLLGIYNKNKQKNSPLSMTVGGVSLLFAAWLVPGLWGAPLKAVSAFCPPMSTSLFMKNIAKGSTVQAKYTDYTKALEASAQTGKPVLIDFTGFGCVNCRKMEASVWTDPSVATKIATEYILVSLYVDDRTPLNSPVTVIENGQKVKIRNVGDRWSLLQRYKFSANAQPFYVIVDSQGSLLSEPYTFDPDSNKFLKFLQME